MYFRNMNFLILKKFQRSLESQLLCEVLSHQVYCYQALRVSEGTGIYFSDTYWSSVNTGNLEILVLLLDKEPPPEATG